MSKTVKVKGVGVLRPSGRLTVINTYGYNGNYDLKRNAQWALSSYAQYLEGNKIVKCTITFTTPQKGKRPRRSKGGKK